MFTKAVLLRCLHAFLLSMHTLTAAVFTCYSLHCFFLVVYNMYNYNNMCVWKSRGVCVRFLL